MPSGAAGDWTSQVRRGVLELCVLALLSRQPSYGYEIVATLAGWTPLAAGENTLYPLLRRLKSDGQLETFEAPSPTGPPRQYYRLTAAGHARLLTLQSEWSALASAVDAYLNPGDTP